MRKPSSSVTQETESLSVNGYVMFVVGIALIASSFLVLARSQPARWVGFVAAGVAAVSAMAWMPYYPVGSVVLIALDVVVIWGVATWNTSRESA